MPAVIYAAKSTEDKHGSIPTQIADGRAMADREGWRIDGDPHTDEGFSAFKGNRGPGLAAAREHAARLAEEHGSCVLVVQHSDRLARGAGDAPGAADHLAELVFWARRHNVVLRSVQDDSNLTNTLLAFVIGERNHEDSRRKSEACKAGARRRVADRRQLQGGYCPYGYERVRGEGDEKVLVVREDQAAVVTRIFSEYNGGAGNGAIAHGLNRDGIKPPRAARWDRSTIAAMVKNPVFAGKVHINGEVFDGRHHEAIIDPAVWERAQRIKATRAKPDGRSQGRLPAGQHLLTRGLLRCGSCGGAMSPRTFHHRPGLEVYLCSTRRKTGGSEICQQPQVARGPIDSAVLSYFASVGLDEEETLARLRESDDRRVREAAALREQAEKELLRSQAALDRAERDYLAGELTAQSYERLSMRCEGEREAMEKNLVLLRQREQEARDEAATHDVEAETLAALAKLRAMVAGHVTEAGDVQAVRAALSELFESFTLRRLDDGGEGPVELDLCLGDTYIEPRLRADGIAEWVRVYAEDSGETRERPVVRLVPLPLRSPDADSRSALSAGTNALLRAGATPLCAVADVLETLGLEAAASHSANDPLLELLPATADELARATGRDAAQLAARLVELELEGAVTAADGIYRKRV